MGRNDRVDDDLAITTQLQWARQRPDVDSRGIVPLMRIFHIWLAARDQAERACRRFGFGVGEMDLLLALRRGGAPYALRPTELQKECLVTSGAITGRIDRLAALGFVDRVKPADDGRSWLVHLTPTGLEAADALFVHNNVESSFPRAYAQLSPADQRELDRLLRALHEAFEADAAATERQSA
jgi:DNA-binding MarR family transcriptional regulator